MSNMFSYTRMGIFNLFRIIMCGYGLNNKILKAEIQQVNDLNKFSKISGKRKRIMS
jgi:hypothetical protein